MIRRPVSALAMAIGCACGASGSGGDSSVVDDDTTSASATSADATTTGTDDAPTSAATTEESGTTGGDSTDETAGPPKFDVGGGIDAAGTGPMPPSCTVVDDMDAVGECEAAAPPDSFDPEIQWEWQGPATAPFSIVAPLVANLTDDNDDGEIDLCDIPDVVVVSSSSSGAPGVAGQITILDGETGTEHVTVPTAVDHTVTPALGDIDDDGLPEIVTTVVGGQLVAFEHDGTMKWQGDDPWPEAYSGAIALADLDNDGDVEIVAGNFAADHLGERLFTAPQPAGNWSATAAADLDDDGDLEVVLGHAAYHHDGAQLYLAASVAPGYPQIANLDGDPEPEVIVMNASGISLLEHDGTVVYQDLRPTGDPLGGTTWLRPATVHDFDGDSVAEFAVSSANHYTVYESDASIVWSANVSDQSGIAGGTAFDFLGDGIAEAMYADETSMFIFDGAGLPLLEIPRTSGTLSEYPVVADIDNDGSAEIVVVSNSLGGAPASPTVQVIRDVDDRWIQARRIWNQHTYHVTNVREDGTIPQFEKPHHELLNTFRTNAQIEDGGVCQPPPQG
jgi:hypothetical protein